MSEQLGQDIYDNQSKKNQYIKDWQYNSGTDSANFYGGQAKEIADNHAAIAAEKAGTTINVNDSTSKASPVASGVAQAAKGDVAGGLMTHGAMASNPYTLAAGGALALDQNVRARNQQFIDNQRKAYLDWYDRVRESDMKLASMNLAV